MRNKGWLRYGLASLTLVGAGLGAFLVACDDDDSTVAPKNDGGGGTETGPGVDSGGGTDAGPDAPVASGSAARLQLVNAATDFGPSNPSGGLRVCFAAGTTAENVTVTPLPALPEASSVQGVPPAVYIGLGGNVAGTGLDLSALFIQPYLMNAQTLATNVKPGPGQPSKSCSDLLSPTYDGGAGPLVENRDYWKLPVVPSGSFLKEKSYLLVLTGCSNDTEIVTKEKCGPGFTSDGSPGLGNLQVRIYEVDRATEVQAANAGTQFVHASASAAFYLGLGNVPVMPGYTSTPGDANSFKGVSTPPDAGVALYAKTDLVQVPGVNFASDYFTANPVAANLAIPLQSIQALSYPTGVPDGGAYANGNAYTFIAVGDADPAVDADAGGRFNTKKFHYLAFPNNPPISVYKP